MGSDTSSVSITGEGGVSLLDLASGNTGTSAAPAEQPPQTTTPGTGGDKPDKSSTAQGETGEDPGKTDNADQGGNLPFDKHPRFKQLISEKNELRNEVQRLKEQYEALSKPSNQNDAGDKAPPAANLFADMDNDKLLDEFNTDPKGFLSNLVTTVQRQTLDSFNNEQQRMSYDKAIVETFKDYAKKNPDFDDMWESGDIKAFMDKNPGHNAISAHQMLTQENRIKAAAEEAAKKAREDTIKEFKIKRNAAVLTGGPSAPVPTGGIPDELRDTKKFGGRTNVLAQRLAALRASR